MSNPSDFKIIHHQNDRLLRLDGWRQNVGAPVALDASASPATETEAPRAFVVLSWNLWVGHGRLRDLVTRIRNGDFVAQGALPDLPLVVLAQEAFRKESALAASTSRRAGRIAAARPGYQREEIVETAQALGMNLRYAPSMRNGVTQSDRGNAILSTLPLEQAHAIELPYVLQRRVAVAATIQLGERSLGIVSAHLDPRGPAGHRLLGMAGRGLQAQHLVESLPAGTVIMGADLNIAGGRYEPAWRALGNAGFTMGVPSSLPTWRHTYHAVPRLVIDYVLVRDTAGIVSHAKVYRLDEHALDKGPLVFGSDHHPLLARIELTSS